MVNIIIKPNPEKKVDGENIKVLNPITKKFLAIGGEKVLQTSYWVRLLSNKSVLKINKVEEKDDRERTLTDEEIELLTKIVDNLPEDEEQKFLSIALEIDKLSEEQKEILLPFIKNEAERLSIKYATNIGFDTLKERVLEAKKIEEEEIIQEEKIKQNIKKNKKSMEEK